MQGDRIIGIIIMVAIFLGVLYASSSCSSSGEEYYHVPGVSVDVDKGRKHYKPAPKPAPKSGGSVGRKR